MDLSHVTWRKSSHSGNGSDCVEVAVTEVPRGSASRSVLVRDSKNPSGAVLAFAPVEWNAFIKGIKNGKFDDLD